MQLEDMSTAELIALVKRQEQELVEIPAQMGMSRPSTMPHGWRIKQISDGRIAVEKEGIGGYAAESKADSIASSILHALASDMLTAQLVQQTAPVAYANPKSIAEMQRSLNTEYPHGIGMVVLARLEDGHDVPLYSAAPVAAPVAMPAASVQGGVDWLGAALELEAQAKKVGSKSAQRAMEAGAHRLRLMGENQPDSGRDAALVKEQVEQYRKGYRHGYEEGKAEITTNVAQVGELSDEQIIEALNSLGVDTYPSKYGFSETQVSATTVGIVRNVVSILAAAKKVGAV